MEASILSAAARESIDELVRQCPCNKSAVMVVKRKIDDILKAQKCCYKRQLTPLQVAVHPKNRDGQMITASGVYDRAARLQGVGFDLKVFEEEAVCVEDHPIHKGIAHGALKHFKTDERFAQYDLKQIVAGSVGASHTNHLLAATIEGRPCNVPEISVDGRCSFAAWCAQPDFGNAGIDGASWWCIKRQIEELWPDIPEIYQSALNAEQHVGSGHRPSG